MTRWREDGVSGESLGDGVEAGAGDELGEDAYDVRSSLGVWFENVKSLSDRCFAWVGVRSSIAEAVAVRRSTSKEAPFDGSL
jgi:hypothetical protein